MTHDERMHQLLYSNEGRVEQCERICKLEELVWSMGKLLDVFTECDLACGHYHDGCIGDCYYVNARRELGIEAE